jgi:hypothetical protein
MGSIIANVVNAGKKGEWANPDNSPNLEKIDEAVSGPEAGLSGMSG